MSLFPPTFIEVQIIMRKDNRAVKKRGFDVKVEESFRVPLGSGVGIQKPLGGLKTSSTLFYF